MSTKTSNFGLIKPDLTDSADITAMNENWDKIDEQLKKAGESGGTDLVETELASTIYGEDPEIDPVIQKELNDLNAELTQQKSDFTEHKSAKNPHGTTASDVGALPKTGGTLSDDLEIECNTQASFRAISTANKRKSTFQQDALNTYMVNGSTEESTYFGFIFDSAADSIADKIKIVNRTNTERNLYRAFGEHNKPSGSYAGNGSATSRTINTGGIGNVCAVWGGGYFAFVTRCGAFYAQYATDNSIKLAKQSEIKYLDGIITMATTNSAFNQNGGSYGYQVL